MNLFSRFISSLFIVCLIFDQATACSGGLETAALPTATFTQNALSAVDTQFSCVITTSHARVWVLHTIFLGIGLWKLIHGQEAVTTTVYASAWVRKRSRKTVQPTSWSTSYDPGLPKLLMFVSDVVHFLYWHGSDLDGGDEESTEWQLQGYHGMMRHWQDEASPLKETIEQVILEFRPLLKKSFPKDVLKKYFRLRDALVNWPAEKLLPLKGPVYDLLRIRSMNHRVRSEPVHVRMMPDRVDFLNKALQEAQGLLSMGSNYRALYRRIKERLSPTLQEVLDKAILNTLIGPDVYAPAVVPESHPLMVLFSLMLFTLESQKFVTLPQKVALGWETIIKAHNQRYPKSRWNVASIATHVLGPLTYGTIDSFLNLYRFMDRIPDSWKDRFFPLQVMQFAWHLPPESFDTDALTFFLPAVLTRRSTVSNRRHLEFYNDALALVFLDQGYQRQDLARILEEHGVLEALESWIIRLEVKEKKGFRLSLIALDFGEDLCIELGGQGDEVVYARHRRSSAKRLSPLLVIKDEEWQHRFDRAIDWVSQEIYSAKLRKESWGLIEEMKDSA